MMRIITGSARGVRLDTLEGEMTRPTTERAKEAVFSILRARTDLSGTPPKPALPTVVRFCAPMRRPTCARAGGTRRSTVFSLTRPMPCVPWRRR